MANFVISPSVPKPGNQCGHTTDNGTQTDLEEGLLASGAASPVDPSGESTGPDVSGEQPVSDSGDAAQAGGGRTKLQKRDLERSSSAPPKGRSSLKEQSAALLPTPVDNDSALMPPPYPPPSPPTQTPPYPPPPPPLPTPPAKATGRDHPSTSTREGKRRLSSPNLRCVEKPPQDVGGDKSDFVFRDSKGKRICVPRVQKELLHPRLHSGSTESIGNVQHVWQDVPRPSPTSDGRHPGPIVREAYMDRGTTFVRRSPPKGLGHPERMDRPPPEWNARTAWCVSEMFDGRSWET